MRISPQTRQTIRDTVTEVFDPDTSVILFGSRLEKIVHDRQRKALQLVAKLQNKPGDQPVEVKAKVDLEQGIGLAYREWLGRTGV